MKIVSSKKEGKAVFEEMVSQQMVFQIVQQNMVLCKERIIDFYVTNLMFYKKFNPVDPSQGDGKRLKSIVDRSRLINKIVDEPKPFFFIHLCLMQKIKIGQIVGPKFAILRIVPVDCRIECFGKI